jgi:CRISPR-associated protein (TIGR03986 family)
MITAPFNFVPLSEKVFIPEWGEWVSHDIPFKDGESGEIEVTVTAESPIFIRDHRDERRFCNHNGQFYIPGSSLKGMVRNVLEIMSFSRISFVDDTTYAVRDLNNAELYRDKFKVSEIYCGWLRKDPEAGLVIDDCGHPGRVSHQELDKILGINFSGNFTQEGFGGTDKEKTAIYKYELANGKLEHRLRYKGKNKQKQDIYVHIDSSGQQIVKRGTLVFTGQPSPRKNTGKKGDGKGYEFVFFDIQKTHPVSNELFEKFKFAYFDGRTTQPRESADWTYWKKRLEKGGRVPVFFRKNEKDNVLDFGLSMLYKLPYKHSVLDGLPHAHIKLAPISDFAETVFGYTDEIGKEALKGRVHFGHFRAGVGAIEMGEKTLILGTPRASYYPTYIEQEEGSTVYRTYMDNDFKIRGWKRYPVYDINPSHPNVPKSKVTTTFVPLKQGVTFRGKIGYFNLKPQEIGALLSALTFHGKKECRHNIGLAKAYGYGKIKVEISGGWSRRFETGEIREFDEDGVEKYLEIFECEMEKVVSNWANSRQMVELFTMALPQSVSKLKYMALDAFRKNKKSNRHEKLTEKHYLPPYSKFAAQTIRPDSKLKKNNDCEKNEYPAERNDEKRDWEYVKENYRSKPRLLDLFIEKYPDSSFRVEAYKLRDKDGIKTKNIDMESSLFHSVMASESVTELENFLKKFPNSKKASAVKEKLEHIKKQEEEERRNQEIEEEWKKIADSKEKLLFVRFIETYPDCQYVEKAKEKIRRIEIEEKKERDQKRKTDEAKKKVLNRSKNFGNVLKDMSGKKSSKKSRFLDIYMTKLS